MKRASPVAELSSPNPNFTGWRGSPAPGAAPAPAVYSVPLTTASATPSDFYAAARSGHVPALLAMLASGCFRATATDPLSGMTALMLAAMHGHANAAALLTRGTLAAYIDLQDARSNTALSLAQAGGHAEVVSLLRARGAGWSGAAAGEAAAPPVAAHRAGAAFSIMALTTCAQPATTGASDTLHTANTRRNRILATLFDAVERNDPGVLQAYLVRVRRSGPEAASLMNATEHRTLPGAKRDDYTPLMAAAWLGYADSVAVLAGSGAAPDKANREEVTALMLAAKKGNLGAVKALLKAGANANLARRDGWCALLLAAFYGHADTVRALAVGGAAITKATPDGVTALMYAAMNGHAATVRMLICLGANSRLMSANGHTALGLADRWQHQEVIRILETDGARFHIEWRN